MVKLSLGDQIRVHRLSCIRHVSLHPHIGVSRKRRHEVTVIIGVIHLPSHPELAKVGETSSALGFDLGFAQNRQEQGRKDAYGSNDGEEFNQRKPLSSS
jgi:hypothetical protein